MKVYVPEIAKYQYRKLFHLSAEDMEKEPTDEFFINLQIYAYYEKKKQEIMKHGQS